MTDFFSTDAPPLPPGTWSNAATARPFTIEAVREGMRAMHEMADRHEAEIRATTPVLVSSATLRALDDQGWIIRDGGDVRIDWPAILRGMSHEDLGRALGYMAPDHIVRASNADGEP